MAALPDGTTVVDRAVMQHNLRAASKLYVNISIQELGALLGVSDDRAEAIATDMISEGRLKATIDQVECMIHFDAGEVLLQWDAQIAGICNKVNAIIDDMSKSGIKLAS